MKKSRTYFYIGSIVLMLIPTACLKNKSVPFPENASGFTAPVSTPFNYPELTPIEWQDVSKDTIPVEKIYPFELYKLPSKTFTINTFKHEKEPLKTIPLTWDKLQLYPFNMDTIKKDTFKTKTFLLPKPVITKSSLPTQYPRSTSGIIQMGLEEGLPGNYISETVMDSTGNIWIATERGLACYKGTFFETYHFLPTLPNGNPDFIIDLKADHENNLWLITSIGSMYKLNPSLGVVQLLKLNVPFARLDFDANGMLWFTAFDGQAGVLDMKRKTIQRFRFPELGKENNFYVGIIKDRNDNIWIGTSEDIFIINKNHSAYRILNKKNGLENATAFDFYETKSGDIWINSFAKGAYSVTADRKNIRILNNQQGFFDASALDVVEDHTGKIWVIDNDTIYVHNPEKKQLKKIPTGVLMFTSRIPCSASTDMDGNLWIGTPQNKMLIIDPEGALPEHLNMNNGLASNDVWGILEDNDGLMWLGTYNGINIYDPESNTIKLITTNNGIGNNRRYQLYLLKDGSILAGGGNGFAIFDKKNKHMTEYSMPVFISAVFQQQDGSIWLGSNLGIYVFNPQDKSIKKMTRYKDKLMDRIWGFLEDKNGKLWVGTISGIYVIDPAEDRISKFEKEDGAMLEYNTAMLRTASDKLWIGGLGLKLIDTDKKTITSFTGHQGLYPETMYDLAESNRKIYIGSQDGLIVVEPPESFDSTGIWHFYNYGKRDGFPFNDYNQMVSTTTKTGQIWWGVSPQMTVINQEPTINRNKPTVYISGISIMDQKPDFYDLVNKEKIFRHIDTLWNIQSSTFYLKTSEFSDSGYYTENSIKWDSISPDFHLPVGLKLPYNQNSLSFSFTNPEIRGRDKIIYRYILEGADKDWSRTTNEPVSRNYYNLKFGDYVFKVATRGFNGVWSKPAVYEFTILPPWWFTWPAYGLYLLLFIGLIVIIDRVQRRRLLKKERERSREKELAQAKEIEKAYNELKATQDQLVQSEKMASLGELTAGIAHEIQNPLNFVNNFSEVNKELITEMKEEIDNKNFDEVKLLAKDIEDNEGKIISHGKRADAIVKNMLLHSRGNSGQKELTDINALADEYLRLSYHGLRAKDKSFNSDFMLDADPDMPEVKIVPQDIGRVLINLINNAFFAVTDKKKMSPEAYKPMVTVSTRYNDNRAEIIVKDNGNGIPERVIEKIFQPFFTTKPAGQGTGLGLSMSYDIITKGHKGEIKVNSKEGEGTEFIIIIPVLK
ncbi:two-component regulator propeller domain-containing protein [Saccharicrinis sp. FJH2]|uniref:two-component regulator propeller domain-containing protein n=1 Tax=Saccharicrinis sp. FJH65 TaxID=3344659 RepID=UPI0035F24A9C